MLFFLCWFIGLFVGVNFSTYFYELLRPMISSIPESSSLFHNKIIAHMIPFFVSIFLLRSRVPFLLFPVIFLKAISFGLFTSSLYFSFGDAGWLCIALFCFSDCVSVIVLLWFWYRGIVKQDDCILRNSTLGFILVFLIICFEHIFIAPFTLILFH